MTLSQERVEIIEEIRSLIIQLESDIDLIVVEGKRDVRAIRNLGFRGHVDVYSHVGKNEYDLVLLLAEKGTRILILTDFDRKGNRIAHRLTKLLESEGMFVDKETRYALGKLIAFLGLRTIEELDNCYSRINN